MDEIRQLELEFEKGLEIYKQRQDELREIAEYLSNIKEQANRLAWKVRSSNGS